MKKLIVAAVAALGMMVGTVASAGVIELTPANPQPSGVKQGLKAQFSLGHRPRSLGQAKGYLSENPNAAKPIRKLQWPDKGKGALMFGTKKYEHIIANFTGYIKFDAPGVYDLEFYANDGLQVWISGKTVAKLDGINPCSSAGRPKVNVPKAGWYDFKAFYYQKEGTACYESEWKKPGGSYTLIPDSAFGYK
ncbi:PA14 domain-containing protein [Shimia sp. SDUM112013]|uniref:PA14 domain-containing protein n=1 Tax=Shimia sp. SDUM112013 TaxID=3136160 RepID=UPI0032EEE6DE